MSHARARTGAGGGGGTDAAVVRYLAEQAVTWEVLHAYRHQGLDAAVTALGERGGVGHELDGEFRSWFAEPRGSITVQVGGMRAPKQRVRVSEVLAWAVRRPTAAQWARLDQLAATWQDACEETLGLREAAVERAGVVPWTPDHRLGLTDTERSRLGPLAAAEHAAQRELAVLVLAAYAADRGGEQLDLLAGPADAHDLGPRLTTMTD